MSQIQKRYVKWHEPTVADVQSHIVYAAKPGTAFSYDLPYHIEIAMPALQCELPGAMAALFDVEGEYQIFVVAKDSTGNLSDNVSGISFFDFNPPPAPSGLVIE
jgi:hypothetical protein